MPEIEGKVAMAVEDTADNAEKCSCPGCPTYDSCMRSAGQLLLCARGKSDCGPSAVACMCGGCPVWGHYKLSGYYFCIKGAAS